MSSQLARAGRPVRSSLRAVGTVSGNPENPNPARNLDAILKRFVWRQASTTTHLSRVTDRDNETVVGADAGVVDEIALATSNDGIAREPKGVVLKPGQEGKWDDLLIGRPTVLPGGDTLKM